MPSFPMSAALIPPPLSLRTCFASKNIPHSPTSLTMNINLELGLYPGCLRNLVMEGESSGTSQQQLTIFYNGKVVVCDVTELQARSILSMANREVEERMRTPTRGASVPASPTASLVAPPMCSPPPGLSMKKSLQRFLQKRQHRIQATSPYQQ